jgi:hypothetical protein
MKHRLYVARFKYRRFGRVVVVSAVNADDATGRILDEYGTAHVTGLEVRRADAALLTSASLGREAVTER